MRGIDSALAYLTSVGIGVEPIVAHHDGFDLIKPSGDPRGYAPLVTGQGTNPGREGKAVSEANVGRGKSVPPPKRPDLCLGCKR